MAYTLVKVIVTAGLIVLISEIAKRNTLLAALFASLPLVSVLSMFWLYLESKDSLKVAVLSQNILLLSIPSVALFVALPILLKKGVDFYLSMGIAILVTVSCYFLMLMVLSRYGIKM